MSITRKNSVFIDEDNETYTTETEGERIARGIKHEMEAYRFPSCYHFKGDVLGNQFMIIPGGSCRWCVKCQSWIKIHANNYKK